MSEAVEYRVKSAKVTMYFISAILTIVGALIYTVLYAIGEVTSQPILMAISAFFIVALTVLGLFGAVVAIGKASDGICRSVLRGLGWELNDPPLDEWEESLEERDAFEVDV